MEWFYFDSGVCQQDPGVFDSGYTSYFEVAYFARFGSNFRDSLSDLGLGCVTVSQLCSFATPLNNISLIRNHTGRAAVPRPDGCSDRYSRVGLPPAPVVAKVGTELHKRTLFFTLGEGWHSNACSLPSP